MDVVCDRCKTEYEFDDALVSERGTTVKCTNCSHQFKIYRQPNESDGGRAWTLRRPDGTVIPFDSLAVLQKWILEGRVSKMDEIARSGDPWKPLGAIAELETFFAGSEGRSATISARPGSQRPGIRTLPPMHRAPSGAPGARVPSVPPGGRTPSQRVPPPPPSTRPTPSAGQAILKGTAPITRSLGGTTPGMAPPSPPVVQPEVAPLPGDDSPLPSALSSSRPVESASRERLIAPPAPPPPLEEGSSSSLALPPLRTQLSDDELPTRSISVDDGLPDPPPTRRGGVGVGVVVGALIASLVGVAIWKLGVLSSPPTSASTRTAVAPPDLSAPHALIDGYSRRHLEDAREALTRLLGAHPQHGAVLAARAQANALLAERLNDSARSLDHLAGSDAQGAERRAMSAVLRAEATRALERAREDFAQSQSHPVTEPALQADALASLVDAARVLHDATGVSRLGAQLGALQSPGPRQRLALALLALDRGEIAPAIAALRSIAERESSPRARLALARALLASGDVEGARRELALLPAADAAVDDDAPLRAELQSADAGAPAVAPPSLAAPTVPAAASPRPTESAPRAQPAGGASQSYDRIVSEGDRLQNDGRTAAAEERFRAALALRPNGAEAMVGMGYVELDRRNYSMAIGRFRQALASNPRYSDAYIGLGEAYSSQSRYAQALEAYQRYLSVNPGGSRASMARRQIESLQERVRQPAEAPPTPSGDSDSDG